MKFRKKIATLLVAALVMTMLPTTVLAADYTSISENSVSGNISGNVNYVDTTVFLVTLPTTASLDFVLDPQGLSTISDNQVVSANDLTPGVIVGTNDMFAVNRSSVPIKISAKFSLTDSAEASSTAVNIVSSNTAVTTSGNDIYMEILTGTEKGISTNETPYVSSNYVADNSGKSIDSTLVASPTEILFQLDAAGYSFTNKGTIAVPDYDYIISTTVSDNYDAVYMKLGGKVSADGDWSDFTDGDETLQLNAVFTFTELNTYVAGANGSSAYGLVTDDAQLDEVVAEDDGPTVQSKTTSGTAVSYDTTAAVSSVTVRRTSPNYATPIVVASTNYTSTANSITFTSTWINKLKTGLVSAGLGVGTYEIIITYASGSTTVTLIVE